MHTLSDIDIHLQHCLWCTFISLGVYIMHINHIWGTCITKALNASGKGIKLNEHLILALLLYADDLTIMAELWYLLNILEKLCKQWHIRVNIKKTKIVHFRTKTQPRTEFNFYV